VHLDGGVVDIDQHPPVSIGRPASIQSDAAEWVDLSVDRSGRPPRAHARLGGRWLVVPPVQRHAEASHDA
jgi:hypothetical protein